MYKPLSASPATIKKTTSPMAPKGVNLRDLPQMMDVKHALAIVNYIVNGQGIAEKRPGSKLEFNAAQSFPGLMLEQWTDDLWLFAFQTTVAAYRLSTGVITNIKTNFVESGFCGERAGDYFFVASPGDKIGRISMTLNYDGQSANFTVGEVVTGATSGATAIVLEDADGGASGTLTLGEAEGTFQDNETINGSTTGIAVVNGSLVFTYSVISGAPYARGIKLIESRLVAFDLRGDRSAVQYSPVDDGTNPPYSTWNVVTTASGGGKVRYRSAGSVNSVESIGKVIAIFAEKGVWAFQIDVIDSAGTLTKVDNIIYYELGGGAKATFPTNDGIFYVNKEGLWILFAVGQDNIPYSDQVRLQSSNLGDKFFKDINLDQTDMVKDERRHLLLITVRDRASVNNGMIVYNTDLKAFSTFQGWNIRKFMKIGEDIYGIGSSTVKVWKLFENDDDDGVNISTEFYQEVNVGGLESLKEMLGQYFMGNLSPSTVNRVGFDIYDRRGRFVKDKLVLLWTREAGLVPSVGFGSAGWGSTAWGGAQSGGTLAESFVGKRGRIKNFKRIRVRITENSKSPHSLNWFSLLTQEKSMIRIRNMTQTS